MVRMVFVMLMVGHDGGRSTGNRREIDANKGKERERH